MSITFEDEYGTVWSKRRRSDSRHIYAALEAERRAKERAETHEAEMLFESSDGIKYHVVDLVYALTASRDITHNEVENLITYVYEQVQKLPKDKLQFSNLSHINRVIQNEVNMYFEQRLVGAL